MQVIVHGIQSYFVVLTADLDHCQTTLFIRQKMSAFDLSVLLFHEDYGTRVCVKCENETFIVHVSPDHVTRGQGR